MTAEPVRRLLVLADISTQYVLAAPDEPVMVVAELPDGDPVPQVVEYLRANDLVAAGRVYVVSDVDTTSVPATDRLVLWTGSRIGPPLLAALRSVCPGVSTTTWRRLAPVAMLRIAAATDGWTTVERLACARIREAGVLFAHAASIRAAAGTPVGVLAERALSTRTASDDHAITENELYTRFDPGVEIEEKIALLDDISPWSLAGDLAGRVGTPDLPHLVPDVGNEYQRWQTEQTTFEILGPPEEAGYIAFIPTTSAGTSLKHKTFRSEALRRDESFRLGLDIRVQDYSAFLAEEYPHLLLRRLPHLTRSKFDVNVESTVTGHFYGIEIDEVTVTGYGATLRQLEIEYHRSRVHAALDGAAIDAEITQLAARVLTCLHRLGIRAERTFRSKLSFLRDLADTGMDRPRETSGISR